MFTLALDYISRRKTIMSDLTEYTWERAARDPAFTENLDSGYTKFKIDTFL